MKFPRGAALLCAASLVAPALPAHAQLSPALDELRGEAGPAAAFLEPPAARGPASLIGEPSPRSAADYRELSERLKAEGLGFNAIFAALARHLEEHPPLWTDSPSHNVTEARSALGGLFLGAFRSALKDKAAGITFQDRHDWVLHFLAGGLAAVASQETAFDQAYAKEASDALNPKNFFDIGDLGATLYGARWVAGAGFAFHGLAGRADPQAPAVFTAWVHAWAAGERSLDALPRLYPILQTFDKEPGQLPRGQIAPLEELVPTLALVKGGMDWEGSAPWPDAAFMQDSAAKSAAAFHAGHSRSWWAWTHPHP